MDMSGMDQPMINGDCPGEYRSPANTPPRKAGLLSSLGIDMQLLAQSIVYCSIVLCGLLVAVPLGVTSVSTHGDVIKLKHFPRYWPFVRGIHRSPVNSPLKGQWRGALMFSLICVWINGCVNHGEAENLIRYRAHYNVIVMNMSYTVQYIPWHIHDLTHWGWNKIAALSQATFSDPFSWMKIYELHLKFHWDLFLRFKLTIFQH